MLADSTPSDSSRTVQAQVLSASQILAQHCLKSSSPPTSSTSPLAGRQPCRLTTGLSRLDSLLAAAKSKSAAICGLPAGSVLEIIGPKGSGKSTFAADIAARWALSACDQNAAGNAETTPIVLVIDTEAVLGLEKMTSALEAAAQETTSGTKDGQDLPSVSTRCEAAMKRIRHARCTNLTQFVSLLGLLSTTTFELDSCRHPFPALLEAPTQCLIVIDSMSTFLRMSCITAEEKRQRRDVVRLLADLGDSIRMRGATAVATNGMTFKLVRDPASRDGKRKGALAPSLNVVRDTAQDEGYFASAWQDGPLPPPPRRSSSDTSELRNWESVLGKDVSRVLLRWAEYPMYARLAQVLPPIQSHRSRDHAPARAPAFYTMSKAGRIQHLDGEIAAGHGLLGGDREQTD